MGTWSGGWREAWREASWPSRSPRRGGLWPRPRPGTPIKLWQISSGEELLTLRGYDGYILSLAFSPDGRTLASACARRLQGDVRLWRALSISDK